MEKELLRDSDLTSSATSKDPSWPSTVAVRHSRSDILAVIYLKGGNDKDKSGSGKSTLVDGMANYILSVNWDDPFRFTIINLEEEEKQRKKNQVCC